ncbi:MAG: RNA-binding protein [Nitratireductor sp.]
MKNDAMDGHGEMNPRSCIVTKTETDRENLIRFVEGPDGVIVPDLKGNLPGRGVWVLAKKKHVAEAIEKKLFAKGLKKQVQANSDLADLTEKLLKDRALRALGMAKKAGSIISGFSKVNNSVRSGKAYMLFHAIDAAEDGKRKLASATSFVDHMGGDKISVFECWSVDEMSRVLGIENAVHVVAIYGGATKNLMTCVKQMQDFDLD